MVLHGHACRDGNPGNFRTYKLCRHVTAQRVSFPDYRYTHFSSNAFDPTNDVPDEFTVNVWGSWLSSL